MTVGDKIRIVEIPPVLPDDDLGTRTLFERCLGRVFEIVGFNEHGMVELQVGEVLNQPSYRQTIWIEPEFVVIVRP